MTIATDRTFEFNIGQIVRQAYLDAGLLNVNQSPTAAQTQDGIDKLQRITTSSAVFGFLARDTDFYTLTLEATVQAYALPSYVVDVTGSAMYKAPGQTTELQVNQYMRERWQTLSNKDSTDTSPSFFYLDRTKTPLEVKLWPLPGTAQDGGTVVFQVEKYKANARSAGATLDFERYWVDYLVFELAARLSLSNALSMDRFTALQGKADRALKEAKSYARQKGAQQFQIGYMSPWRGR